MTRYSVIDSKIPREIVLLKGSGCKWRKCTFCDYHKDFSLNEDDNFILNCRVLNKVKGIYNHLEVINSGSVCDLDGATMAKILDVCKVKNINLIHFECHYMHREELPKIKKMFETEGIMVKIKTGVETFDVDFRENVLKKGFGFATPKDIAEYANEVCLLFGLNGQSEKSMKSDIKTGLKYFERVCVNIMNENSTPVKPDANVIKIFCSKVAPEYINDDRVDILIENTDFGVGGQI